MMLRLSALIVVCVLLSGYVTALNAPPESISSEQKETNGAPDIQPVEGARSSYVFSKLFNFDYFKTTFQKSYNSIMDEMVRKKLFLGRAFKVFMSAVEYKFGLKSSYLAINAMSDWTPSEINRLYSPRHRNRNKSSEFAGGKGNKGDDGSSAEKNESEIAAVEEKELIDTLEKMNEFKDEPGFKEIVQMLKTETHRRVKRETHEVRDISLDDLFRGPTEVEEDSSSDRVPSNNPKYVAPELRSHGSGKQGDRMSSVPKPLIQKILGSSGAKFMAKTINGFTSKFGRLSKKKSKTAAFEQKISLPREKSNQDEHDLIRDQQSVEVDLTSHEQMLEKQLSRRIPDQQSATQISSDAMPPSNPSDNEQINERQMLLLKIQEKNSLLMETIKKQLEQHKAMQIHWSAQKDPQAPSNDTEPIRMTPQQERMMMQRAVLENNLLMLLKFDDTIEKLKKSDKFKQIPQVIKNSTPEANQADQGNPAQVEKLPDQVFVDHRLSNCLFPPRNQGFCGSCYAFSTIALYEWAHCMETGKKVAFSEQYIVDCGSWYVEIFGPEGGEAPSSEGSETPSLEGRETHNSEGSETPSLEGRETHNSEGSKTSSPEGIEPTYLYGCEGGHTVDVINFVDRFGLELRRNYPYTQIEDTCPFDFEQIVKNPESMGYIRVNQHHLERIDGMYLEAALAIAPVLADLMIVSEEFFALYGGGVETLVSCDEEKLHAVLIVGHGREDNQEYWLIRNSFGPLWGDGGYYKLNKQSPCLSPSDFHVLSATYGKMFHHVENPYYDAEKVKSHHKLMDPESEINVQSELLQMVKQLKALAKPS